MQFDQLKRREFITLLGGAAAWPLAARAQQPAMPVIGFLSSRSPDESNHLVAAFRTGLRQGDYVEGQNVAIEYRWAEGQIERLPALAADLARRQVAAIATVGNTPSAYAARAATAIIPIVFVIGDDPVKIGLVDSLSRPQGNVTGVTMLLGPLGMKRFELLSELVPNAATIAMLANPSNPVTEQAVKEAQEATRILRRQLVVQTASTESELDAALASVAHQRADALVVDADPFFTTRRDQLIALTARYSLPAIYTYRDFAAAGGLISYGGDVSMSYRVAGNYIGRILKGAKPADLPVQQATKVELVINLKTAKALGLTLPPTLLARADEVIE
jgi:putative tryptophan/tyrosine transport system substrate-binding protein